MLHSEVKSDERSGEVNRVQNGRATRFFTCRESNWASPCFQSRSRGALERLTASQGVAQSIIIMCNNDCCLLLNTWLLYTLIYNSWPIDTSNYPSFIDPPCSFSLNRFFFFFKHDLHKKAFCCTTAGQWKILVVTHKEESKQCYSSGPATKANTSVRNHIKYYRNILIKFPENKQ